MTPRRLLALGCVGAFGGPVLQQAMLLGLSPIDRSVAGALVVVGLLALLAAVAAVGDRAAAAIQAVVIALFCDTTFGLRGIAEAIWPVDWHTILSPAALLGLLVAGLVVGVLVFVRIAGRPAHILFATFYLASAAATLLSGTPSAPSASASTPSRRPVLLHLVLDSLQAPLAVTPDLTPSPALAEAAQALVADGFHVDALTYTPSHRTEISLGHLLAGYFDRLAGAGYRLEVFHRATPDLCSHPAVTRCETALSRPTRRVARDLLAEADAATATVATLTMLTRPGSLINDAALTLLGRQAPSLRFVAQPLEAREVVERAMLRAAEAPPGTAILAHVMLPHHPYALDADCRPVERPVSEWVEQDTPMTDPVIRQRHFASYAAQMQCALNTVRAHLPALAQVVVIIHGDHGSRILAREPRSGDEPDPNLNGSMLAVRAPGIIPGLSSAPSRLDERLRAAVDGILDYGN